MDGLALAHPYHEGRSCSKFGYIPSIGLGENSVMDRWKDDGLVFGIGEENQNGLSGK